MGQTDEDSKYTKKFSIITTPEDFEEMVNISKGRKDESLQGVFREAVSDYIKKNKDPSYLKDSFIDTLKQDPAVLLEPLRVLCQEQPELIREVLLTAAYPPLKRK